MSFWYSEVVVAPQRQSYGSEWDEPAADTPELATRQGGFQQVRLGK